MFYEELIHGFAEKAQIILEGKLTGVYLHGSMAMDCFNPNKSDIDLIVVIDKDISVLQKLMLMNEIVYVNQYASPKGIEISVVKREYCKPFVYPTPFELHFSPVHLEMYRRSPDDYVKDMNGTDKDLAAHFTVINNCGKVICGEVISTVFGKVPEEYYLDSVYYDLKNAPSDILTDPVYVILNLCRTLAYVNDNKFCSKAEGGRYAAEKLESPTDIDIITEALDCYSSERIMTLEKELAVGFAERLLKMILDGKEGFI